MSQNEWYIFGPRERRAVVAGLRGGQVAMGLIAVVTGMGLLQLVRNPIVSAGAGLFVIVVGGCATFIPLGSRTLDQWVPLIAGWLWRKVGGSTTWTSESHLRGSVVLVGRAPGGAAPEAPTPDPSLRAVRLRDIPPALQGLRIIRAAVRDSRHNIGVIKDARAGTWTGILGVRGRGWAFGDDPDKVRAVSAWGDVVASFGLPNSPVERLQWVERTHPEERGALQQHLATNAVTVPGDPAYDSYAALIGSSSGATQEHEVLVALQVSQRRAWTAIRHAAGGWDDLGRVAGRRMSREEREDAGACAVLNRELDALASRLRAAEVHVVGKLPPEAVARHIRLAYDPGSRPVHRLLENARGEDGVDPHGAWPRAVDEHFGWLRTDSGCHATFHISEWPRMQVGPAFLAPLLLQTQAERTVAVTMEVLRGDTASREVRAAQTAAHGDRRARERLGFRTSAREAREAMVADRVEQELADGHASVRFAGYITVTAPTPAELEQAAQEVEQMAAQSRLELTRLVGQQAIAMTFTLPLCRGVGR